MYMRIKVVFINPAEWAPPCFTVKVVDLIIRTVLYLLLYGSELNSSGSMEYLNFELMHSEGSRMGTVECHTIHGHFFCMHLNHV